MVIDATGIERDRRLCDQLTELRDSCDLAVIRPKQLRRMETSTLLVFEVGTAAFGVQAEHLAEVVRCEGLVSVPSAPSGIAGALNFRQEVVSVLDLRRLLKFQNQETSRPDWVLVLRSKGLQTALLADSVIGVWKIEADSPYDPYDNTKDVDRSAIIERTLVVENRSVAILNVEALTSMISGA